MEKKLNKERIMEREKRNFIIMIVPSIIIIIIGICIFKTAEQTTWFGKSVVDEEQQNAGVIIMVIGSIGLVGSLIYKFQSNKKNKIKELSAKENANDISDTLEKIKKLYQEGSLSKEEYEKRKKILLRRL